MNKEDLVTYIAIDGHCCWKNLIEIEDSPVHRMQHVESMSRHFVMNIGNDNLTALLKNSQLTVGYSSQMCEWSRT